MLLIVNFKMSELSVYLYGNSNISACGIIQFIKLNT